MNIDMSGRRFELCFRPLSPGGQALAFPCDAQGHVQLDALGDEALERYLFARAVTGRDFARPAVRTIDDEAAPAHREPRITRT
jgi:hypothetical protein